MAVKSVIKKNFKSLSVHYAALLINLSNVEHRNVKWTKEENPLKSWAFGRITNRIFAELYTSGQFSNSSH